MMESSAFPARNCAWPIPPGLPTTTTPPAQAGPEGPEGDTIMLKQALYIAGCLLVALVGCAERGNVLRGPFRNGIEVVANSVNPAAVFALLCARYCFDTSTSSEA